MFIIIAGLVNIFFPYTVHADLFGFEVQDVYTQITSNVRTCPHRLKSA